jgi:capsid protein
MTLGRWAYCNFPDVRGALRQQAEYSSAVFVPQFWGADKEWGKVAEMKMHVNDAICDVAGQPYNHRLYRRNLIIAVKRDGDALTVMVKRGKEARLQLIPGHRVGSRYEETVVRGGRYDGARIIDGVIMDDAGAAIAYRVLTGSNPFDYTRYIDIPAHSAFLSFDPDFIGQVRGFSSLGASMFNWQDIAEARRLELLAQKINAGIAIIETNASGTAIDSARHALSTGTTAGTATGLNTEAMEVDGVQIRYLKAKSGASLSAHESNRPSANSQAFEAKIVRSNFYGMDWSVDFSLDPTNISPAPLRVVVEQINRSIAGNQDIILAPVCTRYNAFRLGTWMENEELPFNVDWWKFAHQSGARLTADAKYDSEIDQAEVASGMSTDKKACGKRGDYYEENYEQREREVNLKAEAAKRLAKSAGITFQEAYSLLWMPSAPNGLPVPKPEPEPAANDRREKTPPRP